MIYICKLDTNEYNVVCDVHNAEKKLLEKGATKITDVRIMDNPSRNTLKLSFIAFIYYEAEVEIEV